MSTIPQSHALPSIFKEICTLYIRNRAFAKRLAIAGALLFLLFVASCQAIDPEPAQEYDWRADWGIVRSFSIEEDADRFSLPTSITFVSNPGTNPKDPLYFVTELFGTIKVVTNDRTVYTFAEKFFPGSADRSFNKVADAYGLAGLCISQEKGYIFATFAYQSADDQLIYNGFVRFDPGPQGISTSYSSIRDFSHLLKEYPVAPNHQIGSCKVVGENLYISIGDGGNPALSQELNSPYGKVLRLNLDAQPLAENPFFQEAGENSFVNYVWAYGLRNPYGLETVRESVFTADNGIDLDRFIEILPGENYLWDGKDLSIASRGNSIIFPSVGSANLVFAGQGETGFPPDYEDVFFLAMSKPTASGLMNITYSFEDHRLVVPPSVFLRYLGQNTQVLVALALGPDGLYFAPLIPSVGVSTSVYRIAFDPENEHPYRVDDIQDPKEGFSKLIPLPIERYIFDKSHQAAFVAGVVVTIALTWAIRKFRSR